MLDKIEEWLYLNNHSIIKKIKDNFSLDRPHYFFLLFVAVLVEASNRF